MRTWFAKQMNDAPAVLPDAAPAEAAPRPKAAIKSRRMVYAPVRASGTEARPEGEIRIKAQIDSNSKQIVLMVDRPILPGYSYWTSNLHDAQRLSPLAAALLEQDGVDSVLIHEMNVTVALDLHSDEQAELSARQFGKIIRAQLQSGQAVMSEEFLATMPSEDEIRYGVQSAIDLEINPGIAGHSGEITLTSVVGNTVYIKMGGGCQGCAASSITLRQGVDQSFRNAVPQIGALLDETDHAAGSNPFFTELPSGMR
ncbi:MAG: NifU family protein [Rhodocyclaceae bacterium]|nr:NifU family protein [Rhodocyclaceae bacterium]MBK6906060.1 NifU family protein [Rhodocyclaceae bacterium]